MVNSETRPERESFILVTFFYGASLLTRAYYTDLDLPYLNFTSEPRMELTIPENEGTFSKRELRVNLPLDNFTGRLSSGVPHSPMYVLVEEVTQGLFVGDQNSRRILYAGQIVRVVKNYQGSADKVAIFSLPLKSRLDVALGLPCNNQCGWTLFKGGCGVSPSSHTLTGGIASVDGREITVTTASVLAKGAADARYWKKGYLEKDGLRISVRDYDGSVDTGKLQMADVVPSDWIGGSADITFVAGCDKLVGTCRSRFNGEEFFLGLGYAIPSYQPNFESPS